MSPDRTPRKIADTDQTHQIIALRVTPKGYGLLQGLKLGGGGLKNVVIRANKCRPHRPDPQPWVYLGSVLGPYLTRIS